MAEVWQMWMIFAAILIIAEILTAGFFLFWFGIAAAVAGVLALLGFGHTWQWGIFIILSGFLFAASRRFAEKFTKEQPPGIGANRLIGTIGAVFEEIDNMKNTGQVRIKKEEWRADSETGEVIPKESRVIVTGMDGTHVVVKLLEAK